MDATGLALVLGAVTALLVTAIGPGIRWYFQRRDAKAAQAAEKAESIKTVASLELAVETQKAENAHLKEDRDRWRARAEHLETLLNRRLEGGDVIQSLLRKLPWVQSEPEVDTAYIHTMREKRAWGDQQTRTSRQEIRRVETEQTGDFSVDLLIAGFPKQKGEQ